MRVFFRRKLSTALRQMLIRRQINADPDRPTLRSSVAAATEPVREAAFAVEEKVVWPGADRLRKAGEVARWPLQRLGWALERFVLWPLREHTAGLAPATRGHGSIVAAAVGSIAAGLAVLALVLLAGSGGSSSRQVVVGAAPVAVERPAAEPTAPAGPVLHGAPPSFGLGSGVEIPEADSGAGAGANAIASVGSGTATGTEGEEAAASTSSADAVPAGPAAMKIARRFSEAFVFYEVGKRQADAKTVFSETASPRLARALTKRPPRLPANTEVPKARVVNLVPGPRRGKDYTVSVSLLRVGLTSELRLSLRHGSDGGWEVTDVLG